MKIEGIRGVVVRVVAEVYSHNGVPKQSSTPYYYYYCLCYYYYYYYYYYCFRCYYYYCLCYHYSYRFRYYFCCLLVLCLTSHATAQCGPTKNQPSPCAGEASSRDALPQAV